MSIASEIQALQTDKENIATAIEDKGVTVPPGSGFDDFAGLINDIPSGRIGKIDYLEGTVIPASDTNSIDVNIPQSIDVYSILAYEIVENVTPRTEDILANSIKYISCLGGLYWYNEGYTFRSNNYTFYNYNANGSISKTRNAYIAGFSWISTLIQIGSQSKIHFQANGNQYWFRAGIEYKYRIYYSI